MVGAFPWRVKVDDAADSVPEAVDGALRSFSQMRFELGEGLLYGVEVGTVGREEQQPCAGYFDPFTHRGALMARQIVHEHHVTGAKLVYENLRHISLEPTPLIGPSSTIGATIPVMRSPATNVVFCGAREENPCAGARLWRSVHGCGSYWLPSMFRR